MVINPCVPTRASQPPVNQTARSALSVAKPSHLSVMRVHKVQSNRQNHNTPRHLARLVSLGSLAMGSAEALALAGIRSGHRMSTQKPFPVMHQSPDVCRAEARCHKRGTRLWGMSNWQHGPQKSEESSMDPCGLYAQEWETLASDWHYERALSRWNGSIAVVDQVGIEKIFHDNGTSYLGEDINSAMGVTQQEVASISRAIDLVQLAAGRVQVPLAVLLIGPAQTRDGIVTSLVEQFNPELAQKIVSRIAFDAASGKPTVLGTDLTAILMDVVSGCITDLELPVMGHGRVKQDLPKRQSEITDWIADFHEAAKQYYDLKENDQSISVFSWKMVTRLVHTEVMERLKREVPAGIVSLMSNHDDVALKIYAATIGLNEQSNSYGNSFETYAGRLAWADSFGILPHETDHFFDAQQDVYFSSGNASKLFLPPGATFDEARSQIRKHFPELNDAKIWGGLEEEFNKQVGNSGTKKIELNLKHCICNQARILVERFGLTRAIQSHAAFYTAATTPLSQSDDTVVPQKISEALATHYRLCMAEAIAGVIHESTLSPPLKAHPKFCNFLKDWVEVFQQSLASGMENYSDQIAVLLDRYFPVSGNRRI